VKTRWCNSQEWTNLAESSNEEYGSESAVLPGMVVINIIIVLKPYGCFY
jgi:hypothetical protein